MFDLERQKEILDFLNEKTGVTISKLANLLHVSETTVRRDLNALQAQGKVKRTFGGVVLIDAQDREVPLMLRSGENLEEKKELARKAISFLKDGDVVFFDASSTVLQIVRQLGKEFKNIIAITNGLQTAVELAKSNITTFCTGGKLLNQSLAFAGVEAEKYINGINLDAAFMTCRGCCDGVFSDSSVEEAFIRQTVIKRATASYFIFDKSKLGKKFFYNIATENEVKGVIIS